MKSKNIKHTFFTVGWSGMDEGMYIIHPTLGKLLVLAVIKERGVDFVFWNPDTNRYYVLRELEEIVQEN